MQCQPPAQSRSPSQSQSQSRSFLVSSLSRVTILSLSLRHGLSLGLLGEPFTFSSSIAIVMFFSSTLSRSDLHPHPRSLQPPSSLSLDSPHHIIPFPYLSKRLLVRLRISGLFVCPSPCFCLLLCCASECMCTVVISLVHQRITVVPVRIALHLHQRVRRAARLEMLELLRAQSLSPRLPFSSPTCLVSHYASCALAGHSADYFICMPCFCWNCSSRCRGTATFKCSKSNARREHVFGLPCRSAPCQVSARRLAIEIAFTPTNLFTEHESRQNLYNACPSRLASLERHEYVKCVEQFRAQCARDASHSNRLRGYYVLNLSLLLVRYRARRRQTRRALSVHSMARLRTRRHKLSPASGAEPCSVALLISSF